MKVKSLKVHENGYGAKYAKEKGDVYMVPDDMGETLIAQGIVEEVKDAAKKPEPTQPATGGKSAGDGKD